MSSYDSWKLATPTNMEFDEMQINCSLCTEPHFEDEHCTNPKCTCQDCGEPLPEKDGIVGKCENC